MENGVQKEIVKAQHQNGMTKRYLIHCVNTKGFPDGVLWSWGNAPVMIQEQRELWTILRYVGIKMKHCNLQKVYDEHCEPQKERFGLLLFNSLIL